MSITGLLEAGARIVDKFIPDANARAAAREEMDLALTNAYNAGLQANAAANVEQAKHPSLFVAGARPFIMWTCGIVIFSYYVPMALVSMGLWIYACYAAGGLVPKPDIGMAEIMGLILPMLGIGTLRTVEKVKRVETTGVLGSLGGLFKR
jgi:hypothetical protein